MVGDAKVPHRIAGVFHTVFHSGHRGLIWCSISAFREQLKRTPWGGQSAGEIESPIMDGLMLPPREGNDGALVKVGHVVEFMTPIEAGARRVSFVVLVERELNGQRAVIERLPGRSPISLDVPTDDLAARNWRA